MPKRKPKISLGAGRVINDLRGQRFGRFTVQHFSKMSHGHSYWCAICDCGNTRRVQGTDLITGRIKSCGCLRADPDVRRAAAMRIGVKRRKARAKLAAEASRGKTPPPAYRLDVARAAEIMGCSEERIETLCDTGILRSTYRQGRRRVSAQDLACYLAMDKREAKRCPDEPPPEPTTI